MVVPVSRSWLPTTLGFAMQVPALQKPLATQAPSFVQLVPQKGGDAGEQRKPLQLWVVPATQVPVPLQTFMETIAVRSVSQAGVESHTTDELA